MVVGREVRTAMRNLSNSLKLKFIQRSQDLFITLLN